MTESTDPIQVDVSLLLRYLADETTPAERAAIRSWVEASTEHRRQLVALTRTLGEPASGAEPPNEEVVWHRIAAQLRSDRPRLALHRETSVPPASERNWIMPRAGKSWLGAAAAAAVIATVAGGLALRYGAKERGVPASAEVEAPKEREYVTRPGERATLRLPDGTRVVLGVASVLRVPGDFGAGARAVHLEGEAVFDVVHDSTRPFAVHAGNAVARDLGTRFSVRAYADERRVQVVVAEGEVALDGARTALLKPGQLGRVAADGAVTVRSSVDLDRYLGWTEGRLVFRDTPLGEAVAQLERWYDIDIRLAPESIASLPLTASFDDESAPDVIRLVAASLDLDLSRNGRTYTLTIK